MASLPSLRERRMQASLCHLFKIMNCTYIAEHQLTSSALSIFTSLLIRTSSYQNSFFPLAIIFPVGINFQVKSWNVTH